MPKETDGYVRSIARGFSVVEAMGQSPGRYTMAEIANMTDLNRATARRVLLTLVSLKYVSVTGKYYQLRPRALKLGLSYLGTLPFFSVAQFALEDLKSEIKESCAIAVLDEQEIVYIGRLPARRIISTSLGVGSRLPAHLVSLGRVLLAALPDDERQSCVESIKYSKSTPKTVDNAEDLSKILDKTASEGFAWVDGELDPAICGIAVPLRDLSGKVVAAISVNMISGTYSEELVAEKFLLPLKRTAQEIRAQMR
ncbi:MAG: helix-turn-helix domain-containing protein [Sneathiella sp.]|nr:helix-turn-helix domain-containing protein [Sneathiella sp.]